MSPEIVTPELVAFAKRMLAKQTDEKGVKWWQSQVAAAEAALWARVQRDALAMAERPSKLN